MFFLTPHSFHKYFIAITTDWILICGGYKAKLNILKYFTGVKVQEQDWKAFQSSKQRKNNEYSDVAQKLLRQWTSIALQNSKQQLWYYEVAQLALLGTVKLGIKELINKEQIGNIEPFPVTNLQVYLINSEQIGISEQFCEDQKVP